MLSRTRSSAHLYPAQNFVRRDARRRAKATAAAAVLALASACSAHKSQPNHDSASIATVAAGGLQAFKAPKIPRDPTVAAALSDNKITFSEYDAALQRVVSCVKDKYGDVIFPERQPDNHYAIRLTNVTAEFDAFYNRCRAALLDDIEIAWVNRNAPTKEETEAQRKTYSKCLKLNGFDISSIQETSATSREADAVRIKCLNASGYGTATEHSQG